MKKLLLALLIMCMASASSATTTKKKKSAVKKRTVTVVQKANDNYQQDVFLDVGGWLFADLGGGFGYEHTLGKNQSIFGELKIGNVYSMVGAEAGWRFWINNKKNLRGIYVGPIVGFESGSWGYYDYSVSLTNIFVGAAGGYQWILKNKIVLNVGPSLYYQHYGFSADGYTFSSPWDNGIRIGINGGVGYAF
jgi:hypothetical protein